MINENKAGYKKTKLGWIPVEWEFLSFKEVTKINQGLQIAISERFTEPIPNSYFYITNEFLKKSSNKKFYILNPSGSVLCNEDDILMTRTGNTGKVVTNVSGAFHNNFFKIKFDKEKLIKDYLFYFLTSYKTQCSILILAGISTIPDLNHSDFYKIKIPLPSLPEQKKISQILSTWDKAIEHTETLLQQLQLRKKGLMQQLLTGKTRLVGFSEKWNSGKLGDFLERIIGGGTPSKERPEYWNGSIYWATVKDFRTFNSYRTQDTITEKGLKNSSSNLIPKGTLITATRMGLGRIMIYDIDVAINQDLKAIIPKGILSRDYLYYWFTYKSEFIESLGNGSTVKGIKLNELKSIKIELPPKSEQISISEILKKSDNEISIYESYLKTLQTQKKGLMQQLLTGQKRVKVN